MNNSEVGYLTFSGKEVSDLLKKSVEGDSTAFRQLSKMVLQISKDYFLTKYKQNKLKTPDDVDDLAQSVYLAFHEQYLKIETLENWLRRVLFLTFVNFYKKERTYKFYDFEKVLKRHREEVHYIDPVDKAKILELVKNLSPEKYEIIRLRFWDDLKFSEIAERLNKTEDSVKKMFYRSIVELQGLINE